MTAVPGRALPAADAAASPGGSGSPSPVVLAHVVLEPDDPRFPPVLRLVRPPVDVLHALGDLTLLTRPMVAVIGSREPTSYGIKVAYEAAYEAARAGVVVVSGLARGLDARAHQGALDAGGTTVAVLGSGLGVRYPRQNVRLMEEIARRGLLLSELPPGARPTPFSFPRRNRIIVALSRCLLVVEGRIKGGTSNTVRWMDQFGRSVLAVPGRIDEPVAEGPNALIQAGAKPYLTPKDLLDEFGLTWTGAAAAGGENAPARAGEPRAAAPLEPDLLEALSGLAAAEATVFDVVSPEPVHVDRLAERAGLAPATLLAALSSLELKGLVTQLPGKLFRLAS